MSGALVHIVDDDPAMRDSLAFLLASAGIAAATHDTAAAFLANPAARSAACLVTDVRMPGMTGVELMERLRRDGATVPVVVITGDGDVPLAVQAMKLGAVDFLEKPFRDDALLDAVRAALARSGGGAGSDPRRMALQARIDALSGREREVLDGIVAGKPNKVIAADLAISPRTVEVYRAHLMAKMEAKSLSELVRLALAAGVGA